MFWLFLALIKVSPDNEYFIYENSLLYTANNNFGLIPFVLLPDNTEEVHNS